MGVVLTACAPEGAGSAFISFNAEPDEECVASPDTEIAIPQGLFDTSGRKHAGCARSYRVNLVVNSNLKQNFDDATGRAEPNILQIHSAEVKLTTIMDETIAFTDRKTGKKLLPNPFLVTTNNTIKASTGGGATTSGIATVEVIPAAYTSFVEDFSGSLIRAKIQIFGTTLGDLDIETAVFTYPIEICEGCLILDVKDIPDTMTIDDIIGGECEIGGLDGRVCVYDPARDPMP